MSNQGRPLHPRQRCQNVITNIVVSYVRWIQDGWQRDKQLRRWNQDGLDSQMDGCHANRGNLHFMFSKPKTTKGETRMYSRQERSHLDTRSNQLDLRYVRCKVIGDLRSMEGVTKCARALDKGFRQMRVDPKQNTSDLWGKYQIQG